MQIDPLVTRSLAIIIGGGFVLSVVSIVTYLLFGGKRGGTIVLRLFPLLTALLAPFVALALAGEGALAIGGLVVLAVAVLMDIGLVMSIREKRRAWIFSSLAALPLYGFVAFVLQALGSGV